MEIINPFENEEPPVLLALRKELRSTLEHEAYLLQLIEYYENYYSNLPADL